MSTRSSPSRSRLSVERAAYPVAAEVPHATVRGGHEEALVVQPPGFPVGSSSRPTFVEITYASRGRDARAAPSRRSDRPSP